MSKNAGLPSFAYLMFCAVPSMAKIPFSYTYRMLCVPCNAGQVQLSSVLRYSSMIFVQHLHKEEQLSTDKKASLWQARYEGIRLPQVPRVTEERTIVLTPHTMQRLTVKEH